MSIDWHSLPQGEQQTEYIPVRASDAHHAVDWERVRAAVRRLRPVRLLVVVGAGLYPAVVWCSRVTEPLAAERGVDAAFAVGAVTAVVCVVGLAGGGALRRWVAGLVLCAAVGGTLLAAPTRQLISTWIVGA
ncbi:hypothetical protein M8Z33_07395 [Streptomyces sp. ZAF1911]|uniref:hypothetical protein n=1 Tax=Streptomyces sp. ZAF1911 TaxID=2944129 RepID=UPI00237C43CE|nr:hypothetical protein [Streptomyces sp. ZAF1911]MDD9376498.1 hypothetical protein [Streptomyces sp. ZAF1911]